MGALSHTVATLPSLPLGLPRFKYSNHRVGMGRPLPAPIPEPCRIHGIIKAESRDGKHLDPSNWLEQVLSGMGDGVEGWWVWGRIQHRDLLPGVKASISEGTCPTSFLTDPALPGGLGFARSLGPVIRGGGGGGGDGDGGCDGGGDGGGLWWQWWQLQ